MPTKNEIKELLDFQKEKSDQLESTCITLSKVEESRAWFKIEKWSVSNPNKTDFVTREKKIEEHCKVVWETCEREIDLY